MARFTSVYRSLQLQGDGDELPYAVFAEGVFETSDDDVAARLREVGDGSVVEDDQAPVDPAEGDAPAPARRVRSRKAADDGTDED